MFAGKILFVLTLSLGAGLSNRVCAQLVDYNEQTQIVSTNLTGLIIYVLFLVIIFVVITLLLRSKRIKHIQHERNMLSSLIDNIPDNIYFKDTQSRFIRINKAQAKLLGLNNPDDAIGKSDFDYFRHAQEAFDMEKEIMRTRKPLINKTYMHDIDGEKRFLSDTKIPLIDPNNNCIGTVGITRDITEYKKAEMALRENQAKFKALFDNAPLAIYRLNKEMEVVECNHRFKKMFGYNDDDTIKVTQYEMLVDTELGSLIFDTVMETKEANTEIMLKRRNGEEFIANITMSLLENELGEISFECIVDDITKVAKARNDLIKAKDKAIEADNLKSLFLANMSHEIRTPMNAIIGFSNMLREEDLTPEDKNSFIDVIQSNGNSLMSLIDAIVDFSKLETDQMVISEGEFNFKPVFDNACDYAAKLLRTEEKNQAVRLIESVPDNAEIRIVSDRHRLGQVLSHLISNAVKFTENGEIELSYFVKNKKLNIVVRDTGIGIPKNKQRSIFERFAKVTTNKEKLYGGTGIGLTISKGIIKLLKGTINVNSAPNEGATFTIKIPVN